MIIHQLSFEHFGLTTGTLPGMVDKFVNEVCVSI